MVKADDVFATLAALALNAYEVFGINVVAIVRRISARIAGAGGGCDHTGVVVHLAEKYAATLVRIRFFPMAADFFVVRFCKFKHSCFRERRDIGRDFALLFVLFPESFAKVFVAGVRKYGYQHSFRALRKFFRYLQCSGNCGPC